MNDQPAGQQQFTPVKPGKCFLAIPTYSVDSLFLQCLMQVTLYLQHSKEMEFDLVTNPIDSSPTRARNTLVHQFLASNCEQILFIDSDVLFDANQVLRICRHPEPIVGGFYPAKMEGPYDAAGQQAFPRLITNSLDKPVPERPDHMIKMKYMGTGFLRIKRLVFDVMINKFGPEISFHPDETPAGTKSYAFFSERPYRFSERDDDCRFLTEDWLFCQRCHDLGFDVWGDSTIALGHRGVTTFPLQPQKKFMMAGGDAAPAPQQAAPPASPVTPNAQPGLEPGEAARLAQAPRRVDPHPLQVTPIRLPEGFVLPVEALDDAAAIMCGEYDVPGLKEPPRSVLDAGAHVGLFTYWALHRWPDATVKAYEPWDYNAQRWVENCRSFFSRASVQISALYDHNNTVQMKKGLNSLGRSVSNDKEAIYPVHATDASTIGKFDFVKVDTEGSEIPILTRLDLSATKAVVCEAHSAGDRTAIKTLMRERGFDLLHDADWPAQHDGTCWLLKFARKEALVS